MNKQTIKISHDLWATFFYIKNRNSIWVENTLNNSFKRVFMLFYLTKVLFTSLFIVSVTEIAKRSDKLGGLVAALPLTTILIILWMYFEGFSNDKISKHMLYTAFFVIPTLPMFLIFPLLIAKFNFIGAVVIGMALTITLLIATDRLLRYCGTVLL